LGRFFSPDPVYFQAIRRGDPQQFNLYSYTRGNPLKFVDPTGEVLILSGDIQWLLDEVMYDMAGSKELFDEAFWVLQGIVLPRHGYDVTKMNSGQKLIYEMIGKKEIFMYFAGTDSKGALDNTIDAYKRDGSLSEWGKRLDDKFNCTDPQGGVGGGICGLIYRTRGRPGMSKMTPKPPIYALFALNQKVEITSEGMKVLPVTFFLHESAENLAFIKRGSFEYRPAHNDANERTKKIMHELGIEGSSGENGLTTTIP
jgi:hypothetical protein